MAQTPQTPVHLTFSSELAEDTPIDPTAMSVQSTTKSRKTKPLSAKQKMQRAFANLYDDEEDMVDAVSPAWTSGQNQQSLATDVTMEDVDDCADFEVKAGDNFVDMGTIVANAMDVGNSEGAEEKIEEGPVIRTEWLGTSQFYLEPLLGLQKSGGLDGCIAYREAVAHDVVRFPYDPVPLLTLSSTYGQLGFSDISVANAHRAILLIEAALQQLVTSNLSTQAPSVTAAAPIYPQLDVLAKSLISIKYRGYGPDSTEEELRALHLKAHQILLAGLLGTATNWEGLVVAQAALKLYPGDVELTELQAELKASFLDRITVCKVAEMKKEDLIEITRMGKICQRKYPWMNEDLYKRTPATLREANGGFVGSSCEVKPVVFGDAIPRIAKEGEDVGPLGIFATRDIVEDEIIMVDRTLAGVSDVPSSKFETCDACQGCLLPPYLRPEKILYPSCCDKVAFCSLECWKLASESYHKVLCGHDFDWLYQKIKQGKSSGAGGHWKSVNFLRVVAIVLADSRKSNTKIHPLLHPLLARMSANYPARERILGSTDTPHSWLHFTNVVAPTQILLQLGVNIYTDEHWSPEVIQTIFWRIENNANMATTNLAGTDVSLVNINPNYLFFNHSCEPNVSWHGACTKDASIKSLMNQDGRLLQPGCSAVWCTAVRDIKKGEELKISYVGNPKGEGDAEIGGGRDGKRAWLSKWFDNGCGCAICEKENRVEAAKTSLSSGEDQPVVDCAMEDFVENGVGA
ncbi:hypothetical protein VTL71DRAFT_6122 [Oculimacula yallundae]|uniref:SET domain-containing protein n=1 Tax=Oculimacula yallundae TaxID=86028 RepID=A0ABR4BZK3_9HELO